MSNIPAIVPTGAIRYNTDSNKMECFNGTQWMQVSVSSLDLGGNGGPAGNPTGNSADQVSGARGLIMGGSSYTDTIEYITISTTGNGIDFGNLDTGTMITSGCSSNTRGLCMGGRKSPGVQENLIDYITIAITGNAIDFGDLTKINEYASLGTIASATRGIVAGGENYAPNTDMGTEINYVTMATTGDAVKFGDLNVNVNDAPAGLASPTRGIVAGGGGPGGVNTIQYITIASTGDAIIFGNLTTPRQGAFSASNSTVGLVAGGYKSADQTIIEKIIISTKGNATDFGDLSSARRWGGSMCSPVRAVFAGGYTATNLIDYVSITTGGTAIDFGDLIGAKGGMYGGSNAHGGL